MSFLSFLSKIKIGIGTATAWLHLPAGKNEAGGAPMKIDPGVLMDAIELGALEFDGKDFWITVEEDPENPPEEISGNSGAGNAYAWFLN